MSTSVITEKLESDKKKGKEFAVFEQCRQGTLLKLPDTVRDWTDPYLREYLKKNPEITHFDANSKQIYDSFALIQSLTYLPRLESLELEKTGIATGAAYAPLIDSEGAKALANLTSLRHLNIAFTNFDPKVLPELVTATKHLTSLDISSNKLGPAAMKHLRATHLRCLKVNSNVIGYDGLMNLDLENAKNLEILGVGYNVIGKKGIQFLSTIISNLTHVDLNSSSIDAEKLSMLGLSKAEKLIALNLEHNNLNAEAMRCLASIPHLKYLNVSFNSIGSAGLKYLVEGAKNLSELRIVSTGINDSVAELLLSATNLTHIEVDENEISADYRKRLATLTEENRKFQARFRKGEYGLLQKHFPSVLTRLIQSYTENEFPPRTAIVGEEIQTVKLSS